MDVLSQLNGVLAGRYEVVREIGAGGMATVYLARDVRHDRQVALKVLKPELGAVLGVDRFLSEIKVTANLQHPNLLPLFDSGEANGLLYYVMPFVEGESLRVRLEREKQLPVDEAVRIAVAIAGALDYAHQHQVIHRDLKPENILLQAGQPVVADFGIALAVSNAGGTRVTQTGLSLGTPQYMSPEQATGDRNVDHRTDLYSLGAMTYEMLTGELPHSGNTSQAIIAKLLTEEVRPLAVLRRAVPPHVDAAVRKALEKLPADRFETAKEFAAALTDARLAVTTAAPAAGVVVNAGRSRLTPALAAGLAISTLVAVWALTRPAGDDADARVVRFTIPLGDSVERALGSAMETAWGPPILPSMALSPDGSALVFAAWQYGTADSVTSRLYVRRLREDGDVAIAGTEGGRLPFFSPDGVWIGFFAGPTLKRVASTGGAPEVIADAASMVISGATWGDDGTITYALEGSLYRVNATGGAPELLMAADSAVGGRRYDIPHALPGSEGLLVGTRTSLNPADGQLVAIDVRSRSQRVLLSDALHPIFSPSGPSPVPAAGSPDGRPVRSATNDHQRPAGRRDR